MFMATLSQPDSTINPQIIVERNPSKSRLANLGIESWPKHGCPPGKYRLKFDAKQTGYYVKGKIKAYPKGSTNYVEFGAGDLVTIPKGFSCIWEVLATVDKYYMFGRPPDAEKTCFYVNGEIKAYPKGSTGCMEFHVGDLVTIPKGFTVFGNSNS